MKYIVTFFFCFVYTSAYADIYAEVDNSTSIVKNVISCDSPCNLNISGINIVPAPNGANAGDTYSNETFTPPPPPKISASEQSDTAISNGIYITSSTTPDLNGTYGITQADQNNVNATTTYIILNGSFPGGGSTMPWVDKSGATHIWPSVNEFKAFATAFANYVSAISLYSASNGASGSIPSNAVTIP